MVVYYNKHIDQTEMSARLRAGQRDGRRRRQRDDDFGKRVITRFIF